MTYIKASQAVLRCSVVEHGSSALFRLWRLSKLPAGDSKTEVKQNNPYKSPFAFSKLRLNYLVLVCPRHYRCLHVQYALRHVCICYVLT